MLNAPFSYVADYSGTDIVELRVEGVFNGGLIEAGGVSGGMRTGRKTEERVKAVIDVDNVVVDSAALSTVA